MDEKQNELRLGIEWKIRKYMDSHKKIPRLLECVLSNSKPVCDA